MPITRHFLGWDGPCLERAAEFLLEQPGQGGGDLSGVIAVVAAQRAGRRLLELLVTQAQKDDRVLIPPRIVTVGRLPELLYQPTGPLAEGLGIDLAWTQALRQADEQTITDLLPTPPKPDDLPGWWAIAQQVRALSDDLAGHRMCFADVPRLCEQRGVDLRGEQRWHVLAQIDQSYHQLLAGRGLADPNTQRMQAIQENRCALEDARQVVLIATSDLNDVAATILRRVQGRVSALVMAPETHAKGFDDLGVLRPEYWREQQVELRTEQIKFTDRVTDQAGELVKVIASQQSNVNDDGEGLIADQITVGLGDEHFAGPAQRAIRLAGIPCRNAAGTPAPESRPALLLRALGRFLEDHRFDALAQLLRHPDIERYLTKSQDSAGTMRGGIEDWLTLLDTYANMHLQVRLTDDWLGDPERKARLKKLRDAAIALLPTDQNTQLPLSQWSEPIAGALKQVYAHVTLREHDPDDQQLAASLEMIADLLREQNRLDESAKDCPKVTASQAIALTLNRLTDLSLPDESTEPAIELLGYLELALDDADVLIITGMNEGHVPSSRNADAFLPDSVRSALSMRNNAHRYARDLMSLNAITHSRPHVTLVAARKTNDGDPLTPSRLLLACDDDTLIQRVRDYFGEDHVTDPPPLLLAPGEANRFLIPRPLMQPAPIDKLRVTAFRDYLACPYRFYLKHILKLGSLDDRSVEMDALSFGTLTHAVLQAFGAGDVKHSTDPAQIEAFLSDQLSEMAQSRFGKVQRPAVRVQIEQLRQRLASFARVQACLTQEGWRIEYVEQDLKALVSVDGQPFTLTGRVDRIDHHDQLGYRIYDYKTGDKTWTPDKTHRPGRGHDRAWVDLQLPLYRDLCTGLGVTGRVELGYISLPKTLKDVGPSLAQWSDPLLNSAMEVRDGVIRAVRGQEFWPPSDPPAYADGLERVCADSAMRRPEVIQSSKIGGHA